ncbi:phosphonate ABC transporter, permease protein PhnE [Elioraea sp.]|uniref:phosphonate ABC transporter, permease protein PhnE n=1 Tax=Elioraea sp. TaxID=2185103 RepID=UPI0025BC0790|nr:phosphonate ABC transporter, permease protein PhnE [Elioraea sp.]
MTDARALEAAGLPARFDRPGMLAFLLWVAALALVVSSFNGVGFSAAEFVKGLPQMGRFAAGLFPPSLDRIEPVLWSLLETFQMAIAGTVIGVILSVPFAILSARRLSPHPVVQWLARALVSLFRTVPDLIWALFFVVTVGLGPFAGTLALIVDTVGFCGRFFAEAMEEADRGPQEALSALGARKGAIIACAVLPAALPSMIATSLFSLEKATRSSVVLGLVGAGGIGMELEVALTFFNYPEAATIILAIFVLVLIVEQLSGMFRRRIIT